MMFSTGALSCMEDNSGYTISDFCEKFRERHGAAECRSFSGRVEALAALFDAMQLGPRDCVFVPALVPSEVVRIILFFGASPVFCDVTAESFCLDHRSLENAVRSVMNVERLYPRAVIAEHFCGLPFPIRAIRDVCDRMGLFLIEDCGFGFGCSWDGMECGRFGDYALISLGVSSVFGSGGSGCLVAANGANEFGRLIGVCDGSGWDTADEIYGQELLDSLQKIPRVLSEAESAVVDITDTVKKSDFWMSRGGGRQKSSCSAAVLIAQSEACRDAAVAAMDRASMSATADIWPFPGLEPSRLGKFLVVWRTDSPLCIGVSPAPKQGPQNAVLTIAPAAMRSAIYPFLARSMNTGWEEG